MSLTGLLDTDTEVASHLSDKDLVNYCLTSKLTQRQVCDQELNKRIVNKFGRFVLDYWNPQQMMLVNYYNRMITYLNDQDIEKAIADSFLPFLKWAERSGYWNFSQDDADTAAVYGSTEVLDWLAIRDISPSYSSDYPIITLEWFFDKFPNVRQRIITAALRHSDISLLNLLEDHFDIYQYNFPYREDYSEEVYDWLDERDLIEQSGDY